MKMRVGNAEAGSSPRTPERHFWKIEWDTPDEHTRTPSNSIADASTRGTRARARPRALRRSVRACRAAPRVRGARAHDRHRYRCNLVAAGLAGRLGLRRLHRLSLHGLHLQHQYAFTG